MRAWYDREFRTYVIWSHYESRLTEIIKNEIRGIITDWELCDRKWWDLRITIEVSRSASDQNQIQC